MCTICLLNAICKYWWLSFMKRVPTILKRVFYLAVHNESKLDLHLWTLQKLTQMFIKKKFHLLSLYIKFMSTALSCQFSQSPCKVRVNTSTVYMRRQSLKKSVQLSEDHKCHRPRIWMHVCLDYYFMTEWFLRLSSQETHGNTCRHLSLSQTARELVAGVMDAGQGSYKHPPMYWATLLMKNYPTHNVNCAEIGKTLSSSTASKLHFFHPKDKTVFHSHGFNGTESCRRPFKKGLYDNNLK